MNDADKFLKEALAYSEARKAPAEPLSQKASDAIKAALAEKFSRVLGIGDMRIVILKLLSQGTLTGPETLDKLSELHLAFEVKGEGALLGLLHQMEMEGSISVEFEEPAAQRRYKISDAGSGILKNNEAPVFEQLGLSALFNT